MQPRVIFFDVGNTLLFPNRAKMLSPIPLERRPALEQWQALERSTKAEFDALMGRGRADHGFWWIFHTHLLEAIVEDFGIRELLVQNTRDSANWDEVMPNTREILQRLAERFRLAVISNSDGGIERALKRCGIAHFFESITDSGSIGIEKPAREIFERALEGMSARAEESLYVGDVYSVDYVGATNAGMDAVLFDVAGAYREEGIPRVESLTELERWIESCYLPQP